MALIDRLTNDTSPDFIELDTIKSWIRVEHDLDDTIFGNLRLVAVNEVFNYTQNDFNHTDSTTGELVDDPIPFNVVMACLMLIGFLYENRGEVMFDYGSGTPLPMTYMVMLNPYRKWVGM